MRIVHETYFAVCMQKVIPQINWVVMSDGNHTNILIILLNGNLLPPLSQHWPKFFVIKLLVIKF